MEPFKKIHIGARSSVEPQEVVYMEGFINYTCLHFRDGRKILVATTLKTLEDRFKNTNFFFRSHKSFLVNMSYVTNIGKDHLDIQNRKTVLLSRRKKALLKTGMM